MEKTLTREAKVQLASSLRRRYRAASSRSKKQILGEFVEVTAQPVVTPARPPVPKLDPEVEQQCEVQRKELARLHIQRRHAFTLIWPLVCRRLESRPNINASELFDELRAQYPGRFHGGQLNAFIHRVRLWRDDARARGV